MGAVKTPTRVRHCTGSNPALIVVESEDFDSWGDIPDQLIALGKWLRSNPEVSVSAINIDHMGGEGSDYLAVHLCDVSANSIPHTVFYGE